MNANDLAGFAWIFGTFPGVVEQLVVSTSPLMVALSNATGRLLPGAGAVLLILIVLKVSNGRAMLQSVIGGFLVALVIIWGLQPAKLTLPSGTTVDSVNLTAHSATVALSIQQILASALQGSLSERFNKAGEFLPAQSVTAAAVERAASQFGNTDLARLIRDYNAQCNPDAGVFKETQNSTPIEAYRNRLANSPLSTQTSSDKNGWKTKPCPQVYPLNKPVSDVGHAEPASGSQSTMASLYTSAPHTP
ncbi:hypothetical protein [Pseudomonas aeruginosa]|uniref:hypothetical protein n=1 Tax=Pseudomonas aeruginosa TaxID=287 RepID=UPI00073CBD20|nr:hypothetical protein [Pseudomonas aeruginosa]